MDDMELVPIELTTDTSAVSLQDHKVHHFETAVSERLKATDDERQVLQTIVCAALDIEGLKVNPEIIVEALMHNQEMKAIALRMAEDLQQQTLQ